MYVMSYFTNEEALHLALSRDGRRFQPVNAGRPILYGTVGTRRLRDPFIAVGPEGVFHLLATDGWNSAQIVHATSTDLVTWSQQQLVPVMVGVAGAHNAWAPEFFHDPESNRYHLIWSSVVDPTTAEDRDWENVGQNHRIWRCTTTDFVSYTPAEVFFDPGYSVIDATVARNGGHFMMAFKDERGINDPSTDHKHILVTTFVEPNGDFTTPTGPVSPAAVEGPTFFQRDGEWILLFDHYLEGRYGAASSRDGVTWTPIGIELPAGVRHASVLTLTQPRVPLFEEVAV